MAVYLALAFVFFSCQSPAPATKDSADTAFAGFETRFLDSYWKEYPSNAIFIGYGKYYEDLVIPDSSAFARHVAYSKQWIDSLQALNYDALSDNNKISFRIIRNQLESDIWYTTIFRNQEWEPASYNLSGESYYLIHQPFAPLEERLRLLSKHLRTAGAYYEAAWKTLKNPTKESAGLAVMQNKAGLDVFGKDLTDSIHASRLSAAETDTLNRNIAGCVAAMKKYADSLQSILNKPDYPFRKYSIGRDLFTEKFKFDLATDLSPEEVYNKALSDQQIITTEMFSLADGLWKKYLNSKPKPADSLEMIRAVIDAVSLQHAKAGDFFDSLKNQVYGLKKFILEKNLFDFDTSYPIIVRLMPEYARGVAIATAEFTPPYQKQGDTYYNIDDLTRYPKDKQESTLREMNNYTSQLISIHEAIPGHCLQGIYNNKKSPDVLRSVFQNGAMVEGWAVYTESMMIESGWGNHSPEMQLMLDKLKLRELGNVVIDYQMQSLGKSEKEIKDFLTKKCFQTPAQVDEKYHRATLSQVQLCSYFTGATAILALREEYRKKMGNQYSLKTFHENFLKYGSSPVKYIRERMLQ
jgi:uncharacterized protein (DUF885 family)